MCSSDLADKSVVRVAGEAVVPNAGSLQFDDTTGTGELRVAFAFGDDRGAELLVRTNSWAPGPLPGVWVSTWRGGVHAEDEPLRPDDLAHGWLCRLPGQPLRLLLVVRDGGGKKTWLHADLVLRRAR